MKRIIVMLAVVVSLVGISAFAGDGEEGEKPKKAKKAQPQLADLTLNGKISKMEKKNPKGGAATVSYTLTDADGNKIALPKNAKDADGKVIAFDEYVDADVKIVAKGMEKERGGKKSVMIKTIVSIEKAGGGDAPEAAPAEPAAEPEPVE